MDHSTLPRLTRARAKLEAIQYERKRQMNDLRSIWKEYSSPEYKAIMIQIPGAGLHVAHLQDLLYQGAHYPAIICFNKRTSFTSLDFPHIPAIGYTSDSLEDILNKAPTILNRTLVESLQESDTLYRQPEAPVPIPDYLIPPKEKHHMEAYLAWVEVDFNAEVRIHEGELTRLSTSQLSTTGRSTADLPSVAVRDYTSSTGLLP